MMSEIANSTAVWAIDHSL